MLGENEQVIPRPRARAGLAVAVGLVVLMGLVTAACSGGSGAGTSPSPSTDSATPSATPAAVAPAPAESACYRLSLAEATAPTSAEAAVPCNQTWTARTFHVGPLDAVTDGHLLTVDSAAVQQRVAGTCPRLLAKYLGGTPDDLRLSVFRSVWFTPTVEESDAGADWLRCDVVALARADKLAKLSGKVKGVLDGDFGATYGLCGTAAPDDPDFERVMCAQEHSWEALETVDLDAKNYPGRATAQERGIEPCTEAARAQAEDALDFKWGYEWPTRAQWAGSVGMPGQRYGVCWAPSDGS